QAHRAPASATSDGVPILHAGQLNSGGRCRLSAGWAPRGGGRLRVVPVLAGPPQPAQCLREVMTANDRIPQVLVVDDEPNIRELVQVALKFHGCAVSTAASGADALRQAESARPDLIVLDVVLPDIDGFEVCRRLRAEGNEVPV